MVAHRIFPLLIAMACSGCVSTPREPTPNITIPKNACIEWHASGGYDAALQKSVSEARAELERYLRHETPQNFAIVLDIDETLLSNWQYLKANQFAMTPASFAAWIQSERALALSATRELYARAQAYSIPIFLVTGRNESLRAATIRDLEEAGYWGWTGLYMKPSGYTDASIIPFKSGVRKMLTDHGYDIILNVGDQDSDLAGGFARRAVKLPNPFYFIP